MEGKAAGFAGGGNGQILGKLKGLRDFFFLFSTLKTISLFVTIYRIFSFFLIKFKISYTSFSTTCLLLFSFFLSFDSSMYSSF